MRALARGGVALALLGCSFDGSGHGAPASELTVGTSSSSTGAAAATTGPATTVATTGAATTGAVTGTTTTTTGDPAQTSTTTGSADTTGPDCSPEPLYVDGDGDGFGDAEQPVTDCPQEGLVSVAGDCDDGDALRFPGAPELCNTYDDDCDGVVDEYDPVHNVMCDGCTYKEAAGRLYALCGGALPRSQARADCVARGIDLAIDTDWTEHNLLVSWLPESSGIWYLGAQDGDGGKEGMWTWIDGTPLSKADGRWGPSQPDGQGSNGKNADCLGLVATGPGQNSQRWVDETCQIAHHWICEGPA